MIIAFYLIIGPLVLADYLNNRNICSPVFLFCCLWTFICTFAFLSLYNLKNFSNTTIAVIMCGVVSFSMGGFVGRIIKIKHRAVSTFESQESLGLNMQFLKIILVLVFVGNIISLYYTIKAFNTGKTYLEIRGSLLNYNDEQIIKNQFISSFVTYFCGPAKTVLMPLAIIFSFNRTHKKFCMIVFLCIIAGIISSGGRITILYTTIQLIAALGYYKVKISKKAKRNIFKISILLIVIIIVITNLRTNSGIWFSIYSYFSVPVVLLSEFMAVADNARIYTYGGATLYPFMYIANFVTDAFGMNIKYLNSLVYYVGLPQATWIELFPGKIYNAFCSLFYFFYLDFRMVGVAIFSFLYGVIVAFVYKQAFKYRKQKYFLWYLLLLQTIFGSFIIWQLGNTKFFVSISILLIASIRLKFTYAKSPKLSGEV